MGAAAVVQARLRERLGLLSLTPFDQATAEGRSQERHRRLALAAAAAALAKVLSVGTALISVPLTLHYLGAERFGMWVTISSLVAMLTFADFGIANGVLTEVASAHGQGDTPAIQRIVSSGFFLLLMIGIVIGTLFAVAYPFIAWHKVLNVQGELAKAEAGPGLAMFVGCFAAAIPLAVVQRVQMGLQQGFAASLWQCAGSLCGLAGVLLVIQLQGGLPWLVLALAGAPLAAALLNSTHFYYFARTDLRPKSAMFSGRTARRVVNTGVLFLVLQATVAALYASDSLVIAHLMGSAAVASYAVPEKLFSLITMAMAMVLAPLWPAYGEAISRGDNVWVRRTLRRSVLLATGVAAAAALFLVAFGSQVLNAWVGSAVEAPLLLLVGFAVWKIVESGGTAVAMFMNGARVVRQQIFWALPTALGAIALKIYLVQKIGISGAVWASVIAYLLLSVLPISIYLPKVVRTTARPT